MNKHGLLCCSLLLAVSTSAPAGLDRSERLGLTTGSVILWPVLSGTGLLMTATHVLEELSDGDRRVLVQAREGALHAVASGDLNDVRLQAALALLRSRFALEDMSDLQLAQWIAVNG